MANDVSKLVTPIGINIYKGNYYDLSYYDIYIFMNSNNVNFKYS